METPVKKSPLTKPVIIIGACSILLVLACGLATMFGLGGYLLTTRLAKTESRQTSSQITPKTGEIQDLRGWVEVQGQDGEWAAAESGQMVSAGQHIRTGALSSASIRFYDDSKASLQEKSELAIDELNVQKPGKPRTILMTQVSGESDHQVTPNKLAESRYEVSSPAGTGQAKGTEFQVIITPEQGVYYYVTEGVVAVTNLSVTVEVNPGQMTIVLLNQAPSEPVMSVSGEGAVSQIGDTWIIGGQTFAVSDSTSITGEPKVGDWVLVNGHLLADGTKAADWIILLHPVETNHFSLSGKVDETGDSQWKVNGQTITITKSTVIEGEIAVGDTVQVDGQIKTGGTLEAEKIRKVDANLGQPFEFTGAIQETGADTMIISGVAVSIDAKTTMDDGLVTGDLVEVKGYIQADGTWLATSIIKANDETHSFEFTGKLDSKDPWRVSGIAFQTRDWTQIEDGLEVGAQVRVEGQIESDGTWIASKIELLTDETSSTMTMIGTVFSVNPWIINGIPVKITDATVISGDIKVGMLVQVEMVLQADGTWLVVKIQPLSTVIWFPGCVDIVATVVGIDGKEIQLADWPLMQVDDSAEVKGTLIPGSVVRIRVCYGTDMTIRITYIIIIEQPVTPTPEPEQGEDTGGKVLVCHKPSGKKGGHTLSIGRSALPAHLGHGDYAGACH